MLLLLPALQMASLVACCHFGTSQEGQKLLGSARGANLNAGNKKQKPSQKHASRVEG